MAALVDCTAEQRGFAIESLLRCCFLDRHVCLLQHLPRFFAPLGIGPAYNSIVDTNNKAYTVDWKGLCKTITYQLAMLP